jgi:hypothetical protein
MNRKSYSGTPVSSKPGLNSSKSLFHDFVRPRGQFSSKHGTSPFKVSPHAENFDFIPLSFSSPVNSMRKKGGGNWKGHNRKSFVGSPANSSWNSSFGPYNMNRKQFHNSSSYSNGSSSCSPYNNMDTPRNYSSNSKKMVGICKVSLNYKHIKHARFVCTPALKFVTIITCAFLFIG